MLRFRWKHLLIPAVLCGVLVIAPNDTFGQRGGGSPGGGGAGNWGGGGPGGGGGGFGGRGGGVGGGFDSSAMADSSFNRLVQSYGGSGDTLDYSKIPANVREQTNMMAQRFGGQPMPATGTISRQQYKAEMDQRMAAVRSRFSGGPNAPASPTAPPTAPGSTGVTVKMIGPDGGADGKPVMVMSPGMNGQPNGFGGPGQGWNGGGGPGGPGGGGFDPDSMFRQMDVNPADGKLSRDEVMNSRMGRRLADSFDQYDTNKDGFISLDEYKVYVAARMNGMGGGPGGPGGGGRGFDPNQGGFGGGGGNWGGGGAFGPGGAFESKREEAEEERPVVIRYGKLPQGLPAWFTSADYDKDGQIGLYEWVKMEGNDTDAKLAEFKSYDLNGDGLVTAEEYMRATGMTVAATTAGQGRGRGGPNGDSAAFRGSGEMPANPSMGDRGGPSGMGGGRNWQGGDRPQFNDGDRPQFGGGDRPQFNGGDRGQYNGPLQTGGDGNRGQGPNGATGDRNQGGNTERGGRGGPGGGDRGNGDRGTGGGDRGNNNGGGRGGRGGPGGPGGGNPFNPGRG